MGSVTTLLAGTAIAAGAVWLGQYARSIRKGYGHDPAAKTVTWSPGQIPTPPAPEKTSVK
jgi:hypothetical protein